MTNVVIVESPAKAKTINKYLGPDYIVLASYGHVRDLPSKDGSVRPESDFEMDWEVDDRAKKHLREITKAVKGADHLYLATDPDREGEAISWHVREVLEAANTSCWPVMATSATCRQRTGRCAPSPTSKWIGKSTTGPKST